MIKEAKEKWNKNNPEYYKQWYEENPEYNKEYGKNNREELRKKNNKYYKERNQRINKYKLSKGCAICGYNKFASALCFHHQNGNKDFCVASIKTCKWEKIEKEINKCIILCLNCHAEVHEKSKKGCD